MSFQSRLISVHESLPHFVSFLLEEKEEKHKMPSSTLSSQLGRHFLSVETLSRLTPLKPQCQANYVSVCVCVCTRIFCVCVRVHVVQASAVCAQEKAYAHVDTCGDEIKTSAASYHLPTYAQRENLLLSEPLPGWLDCSRDNAGTTDPH